MTGPLACPAERHDVNAYKSGRCRCPLGRAAHTAHVRQRRREKRAQVNGGTVWGIRHGITGYDWHGCRCHACRTAKSEAHADQYRASKEARA